MCGHVGLAGSLKDVHKKMFRELLILDTIRGYHSTGAGIVDFNGTAGFVKKVGNPHELFDSKSFEQRMAGMKKVLIGHNRQATKGTVVSKNAHPFQHGRILGAHNGTLRNQYLLDEPAKFEVDSDNLFYHLEKHGVQATTPKLNGAYALVWHDSVEDSINFLRNDERPLFFCYTKDRKVIMWASEDWMLYGVSVRNGVEITPIVKSTPDMHYKITIPKDKGVVEQAFDDIEIKLTTPWKGHVAPPKQQSSTVVRIASSTTAAEAVTWSLYAPYLNEDVEYYVTGSSLPSEPDQFIECSLCEDENITIRAYVARGSSMWAEMIDSPNIWAGKAKRYSPANGGYLILDLRTVADIGDPFAPEVEEVDLTSDEDEPIKMYKGFQGRLLSPIDWARNTMQGCAWCSDVATTDKADDIHWISSTEFVCGDCCSLNDVKQYL